MEKKCVWCLRIKDIAKDQERCKMCKRDLEETEQTDISIFWKGKK